MAENCGVMTRNQQRKMKEGLRLRQNNAMPRTDRVVTEKKVIDTVAAGVTNRRSYPPDPWMASIETACIDHNVKQRRTLCDRQNMFRRDDSCDQQTASQSDKYEVAISKSSRLNQLQSCSAGTVIAHRPHIKTERQALAFASLIALPDSPFEYSLVVSPPQKDRQIPAGVDDIDEGSDSLETNIYAQDIIEYLQEIETHNVLPFDFLDTSPDVTTRMRGILMDWIIQVQVHEELHEETLHLCVSLIDRILSQVEVTMSTLQLIGTTCLLVASKFCERFAPEIKVLSYLTDDTFTEEQIRDHEMYVLDKLDFRLGSPVCTTFLDRFLQVQEVPLEVEYLAKYILDLSITNTTLVPVLPSLKAASALYLSRVLFLDELPWTRALAYYSNYEEDDLHEIARELSMMLIKSPQAKFQGARKKFSGQEYSFISMCDRVDPSYIIKRCYSKDVSSPE